MSRKGGRAARGRGFRTDGVIVIAGSPGLPERGFGETLVKALPSRAIAVKAIREDKKRDRRNRRDEMMELLNRGGKHADAVYYDISSSFPDAMKH